MVSLIVLLFMHASGDPAALLLPEPATLEDAANYRKVLGLDRPIYKQYLQFMANFCFW